MQAFDTSTTNDVMKLSTNKISKKANDYTKHDTNFLAFQGDNTPTRAVEYFNVGNTFGQHGKGEFKAKYGFNVPAKSNVDVNMTEKLEAVIEKDGKDICPPGNELINGSCKPIMTDIVCQPGWVKKGGICVKDKVEFNNGYVNTTNTGVSEDGVTLNRMRKYMQEMQTGEPSSLMMMSTNDIIIMSFGLFVFACIVFYFNKDNITISSG